MKVVHGRISLTCVARMGCNLSVALLLPEQEFFEVSFFAFSSLLNHDVFL